MERRRDGNHCAQKKYFNTEFSGNEDDTQFLTPTKQ
jgi:hypothetical protein